jgi:hypothetical protein
VVVGVVLALLYHLFSVRTTSWLAGKGGRTLPLLSVAAFLLRLTVLGVLFLVMGVWLKAQVDLVATALAFIAVFTLLTAFSLYRFAVSGRSSRSSTRVMP